jgi:hypothetical protein
MLDLWNRADGKPARALRCKRLGSFDLLGSEFGASP